MKLLKSLILAGLIFWLRPVHAQSGPQLIPLGQVPTTGTFWLVMPNAPNGYGVAPCPPSAAFNDYSLIADGVSPSSIIYTDGLDTITITTTNGVLYTNDYYAPPITSAANVAGYISWGEHDSSLGDYWATNGNVRFSGNSSWCLIETIESFNGQQQQVSPMGNFVQWLSPNALGGTNYSCTPVGAVGSTEEPNAIGACVPNIYFGLWGAGKNFAICAWNAPQTHYFQAVGDPFVTR
jgi:hypothetical protein